METLTPPEYWTKMSNGSAFMKKLFIKTAPIISRDMKRFANDPMKQSFEQLESSHERFLKSLVTRIGNLSEYFDDVFLTLTFLRVEKSKITSLYGESIDPKEYYKYHYDNFLIRMVTALDICAKLGNALFDLNIPERNMYPQRFYEHRRMKGQLPAEILKNFADYLDNIKQDRHRKVHQGASKENKFDKVLFWEGINRALDKTPEEHDLILEEYTQTQISEVLNDIDEITRQSILYVVGFMESSLPRLELILATHSLY